MQNQYHFALAAPEILLLILACAALLFDAFSKSETRHGTFVFSILATLVLAVLSLFQWNAGLQGNSFGGLYVADSLSHFLKVLSCLAVMATLVYGREYAEARGMLSHGGEFYSLSLLALLGQFVMISAGSMLTV
jgi:NADH-quinone oxidoreductase subunit N